MTNEAQVTDAEVDAVIAKYVELEPNILDFSTVNDETRTFVRKLLEAALRARPRQEAVPDGWQPIETAPTDDTLFLAGWPDGRMAVLKGSILAAQKSRTTPTPEHLQFQCTHWQPLPAAPKPPREKG